MISRRAFGLGVPVILLGCKKTAPEQAAAQPKKIAVIPKGTTHEFWKAVHAGAAKAGKEQSLEVIWKGPLREDDLRAQIDVVQSFVSQGVAGIVLAPLSDKGLVGAVKAAVAAKIPVVVFDSDLQGDAHASFVATDNRAAGKMAAEHMAKGLGGKGNVAVLRYQEGSASTQNREAGFLDEIRRSPDIKVVSENQYGGATTETAFATAENLLAAQKAASGGLAGVFCPNESTTFGMLLALRKAGIAGKIKFSGFDGSDKLFAALREGHIDGLVLQNPLRMGYLAVKTMSDVLAGKTVEKRIDTGAGMVTKDNVDTPALAELVKPDVKGILGE